MFGNMSGEIMNEPRVLFAAARDGVIPPKILARVHTKYTTPHVAIIFYTSVAFLLAVIGGLQSLMIASSAAVLVIYLDVALSVIKLRKKVPEDTKSFRIPCP